LQLTNQSGKPKQPSAKRFLLSRLLPKPAVWQQSNLSHHPCKISFKAVNPNFLVTKQLTPAFRRVFLSANNGSPSLERPVVFGFPVRQFRKNRKVRFNVEAEKCSVLEHDADGIPVISRHEFNRFNDLPFNFRESISFTFYAGVCNLRSSHGSPFSRRWFVVRDGSAFARWPILFLFIP